MSWYHYNQVSTVSPTVKLGICKEIIARNREIKSASPCWYRRLKVAQLWETDTDDTFTGNLEKIHELEYKLSAIEKLTTFNGIPQRRDNIVKHLNAELEYAANEVLGPLISLFDVWLSGHALTDPQAWAKQRTAPPSGSGDWEEYYSETGGGARDRIINLVDEYFKTKNGYKPWFSAYQQPNWTSAFSKMINENSAAVNAMSSVQEILALSSADRREMFINDGFEEINMSFNTEFQDQESAEAYINSLPDNELAGELGDFIDDIDSFAVMLEGQGILDKFLTELNTLVFPHWFNHWQEQGIEETRQYVEETATQMKSAKDVKEKLRYIHKALHTMHQSGKMIEHFETYANEVGLDIDEAGGLGGTLEIMDSGQYIPQWNEDLEEAGFSVVEGATK
jgi:hypothetical protein